MQKRITITAVALLVAALAGVSASWAAKPEDVFKGKIIITKGRLPLKFSSQGAFVSALQKAKVDKIWPTEEKNADQGEWNIEYIAFFAQPLITYAALFLIPATWWFLEYTHAGLALRAIGENPTAALTAGVPVVRIRLLATLVAGALGGMAGGVLVLSQAGTFVEGMSAGRGFIAIAIVVLGRWHPLGVGLAAFLFAATTSLQYVAQALGLDVPYQLILALPYVLTLAALAGLGGRATPPATLARVE